MGSMVGPMDIVIETLTGNAFDLRVHSYESILNVKAKIQRHEGIPISQQHLVFQSVEMNDDNDLDDYGVYDGARLKLVLSMRGGPINIRRVPTDDSLKEMKTFVEANVDELLDKTLENQKITLLVYKEGEQYKFCRFMDVSEGDDAPLSATMRSRNIRRSSNSECIMEDIDTKQKVLEIQNQMAKMKIRKSKKVNLNLTNSSTSDSTPGHNEKVKPVIDSKQLPSYTDQINSSSYDYKNYVSPIPNKLKIQSGKDISPLRSTLDKNFARDLKSDTEISLDFRINNEHEIELSDTSLLNDRLLDSTSKIDSDRSMKDIEEQKLKELYSIASNNYDGSLTDERKKLRSGRYVLLPNAKTDNLKSLDNKEYLSSQFSKSGYLSPLLSLDDIPKSSLYRLKSSRQSPSMNSLKLRNNSSKNYERNEDGRKSSMSMKLQRQLNRKVLSPTLNLPPVNRKKRTRCRVCSKKTGLATTYNCRCDGIFCSSHRYPEMHDCTYDFKNEGRKLLNQNNPVITAAKLPRI